MAFRTVPFDKLKKRIRAISGYSSAKDDDLQALIDGSVHFAYEEIKYWPRYLRVQPRTLSRGYVDFSEDSIVLSGAGTGAANGLYIRTNTLDGGGVYQLNKDDDAQFDTADYSIYYDSNNTAWVVNPGGLPLSPPGIIDDTLYVATGSPSEVPTSGWQVYSSDAESPVPNVDATKDIGQVIKIWNSEVFTDGCASQLDFYSDANGVRVPRGTGDIVWVAYKEELTSDFGDGTGGTVSDIPYEFSEYAVYDVAYQLQFAARQGNANQYPFAYRKVTDVLDQQKLQVTEETGHRIIADRFKTMYGVDVSVRP